MTVKYARSTGSPKKFADPIRYLGDVHDFIRVLYFLRNGLTAYQFSKLMSVDSAAAVARLNGWVKTGLVRRGDDGRYYLSARKFRIVGFGVVEVTDSTIRIEIDPQSKFALRARYDVVPIEILDSDNV